MKKNKLYKFVLLLSLAGLGWVVLNLFNLNILPGCIFHKITGIPCPACGSTRAVIALINGDFKEGMHANPLGILTTLVFAVMTVWIARDLFHKKETFYRFYLKINTSFKKKIVCIPFIILLLINWIWNISKHL